MNKPLSVLVPVGALAIVYFAFVGAEQLPERAALSTLVGWLVAGAVLLLARAESLQTGRSVPGGGSGVLFLLFGPLFVAYYLFRTRRERHWGVSSILAAVALSPVFGYAIGAGALWAFPIPPRFVDLDDGQGPQRVTPQLAAQTVQADFERIARFLAGELAANRPLPRDVEELYERFHSSHASERILIDLFTGSGYYYEPRDTGYGLWSTGPDRAFDTADDLRLLWPSKASSVP